MIAIDKIAEAISEGFKLFNKWQESAYYRKAEACKESAEKYILTNEDTTIEEKHKKKLLVHFKKRFLKYN